LVRKLLIIPLTILALFLPVIVVSHIYAETLSFDPVKFINGFVVFFLDVLAIGLGFLLIHVFWTRYREERDAEIAFKRVLYLLIEMKSLIVSASTELQKTFLEAERQAILDHEKVVLGSFSQMKALLSLSRVYITEVEFLENQFFVSLASTISAELIPDVEYLSKLDRIYPNRDDIIKRLERILKIIDCLLNTAWLGKLNQEGDDQA